ncbi:TPA: hypothetical protein ACIDZK_006329, partial [Pseudomonas aeruginosa]
GITCQGCGFINTPRATLTTGKPIMDGQRLERFQVDGGDIVVEGAELNVGNLEQFDLITRSAKLNAKLYAKNLNIVTGRNDVQADSLQATPRAADGSEKPQLAIDSSALGGMYAGAIRLVGTEQGVGVKLAGDMAASGGDIRIDASGKLSLAQASSQGDLKIAAQAVELNGKTYAGGSAEIRSAEELVNRQSLAARERIALDAARLDNAGVIEAGVEPDERRNARGDLELRSGTLRNAGSLVASRALEAKASQALDNQGGSLKGATVRVDGGHLDNRGGVLVADAGLSATGGAFDNRDGGSASGKAGVRVEVASLRNDQGGKLLSDGRLDLAANAVGNAGGRIAAKGDLQATLGSLAQQGGELVSEKTLKVAADTLDNSQSGLIAANGGIAIEARQVDNRAGEISSTSKVAVNAREQLDNRGGKVIGDSGLRLTVQRLLNQAKGVLAGRDGLSLDGGELFNGDGGRLDSQNSLSVSLGGVLHNQGGALVSEGSLTARAARLDNRGGTFSSAGALALTSQAALDNQGGRLLSDAGVTLKGASLDNSRSGVISAKGAVDIRTGV